MVSPIESENKPKVLTVNGLLRVIWILVDELALKEVTIPCYVLDRMPESCKLQVNYNRQRDEFTIKALDVIIEMPKRNLIVPN